MKKRRAHNQSKHAASLPMVGNYAKPPLTNQVPPINLTNPLTAYQTSDQDGYEVRNIPEQNVLRMREFDIENKK